MDSFLTPNRSMRGLSLLVCLFLIIANCERKGPTAGEDSTTRPKKGIYLTGRVLDNNNHPVSNAFVKLAKRDLKDSTNADGVYELVDSAAVLAKPSDPSLDSLQIRRDGQIITTLDINAWIDTLPDVFVIQRDMYGTLLPSSDSVAAIIAVITGDGIPSASPKTAQLWYNVANNSYSGFVYFVYSASVANYSVRIEVYSRDKLLIGKSALVDFPSNAGDINIPAFKPGNAKPFVNAGADTTVSINDTVRLHGTAIDHFGEAIVSRQWRIGSGTWSLSKNGDTVFKAPTAPVAALPCVFQATDSTGNTASDTLLITVVADTPVVALHDTMLPHGDSVVLHGIATQRFGAIVSWEWDIGATGAFVKTSSPDTVVRIPDSSDTMLLCIARATDDDGLRGIDTMHIKILQSGQYWTSVTPSMSIPQNAVLQPFKNRLFLFQRGSTLNNKNSVWSSTDGITWSVACDSAPYSPNGNFGVTVFDSTLWVIGGSCDAALWKSTDGSTWTSAGTLTEWCAAAPTNVIVQSFKEGLFLFAKNIPGGMFFSSDGIVWTRKEYTPGFSFDGLTSAVSYGGNLWLIAPKNTIWQSNDGVRWDNKPIMNNGKEVSLPAFGNAGCVFKNEILVISVLALPQPTVYSTINGTVWKAFPILGMTPSDMDPAGISIAVFKDRIWIASKGLKYSR